MWDLRNEILHEKITPQQQRERNHLLTLVEEQFKIGPNDLQNEDKIKLRDKPRVRKLANPEMKLWIKSMELARDTAARLEARRAQSLAQQQQCMQNFLQAGQNRNTT